MELFSSSRDAKTIGEFHGLFVQQELDLDLAKKKLAQLVQIVEEKDRSYERLQGECRGMQKMAEIFISQGQQWEESYVRLMGDFQAMKDALVHLSRLVAAEETNAATVKSCVQEAIEKILQTGSNTDWKRVAAGVAAKQRDAQRRLDEEKNEFERERVLQYSPPYVNNEAKPESRERYVSSVSQLTPPP